MWAWTKYLVLVSKLTDSKLEGYPTELLKIIVASIGKEFSGRRASCKKAADIIVSYVRDSHQNMDEEGGHCPHYELRIKAWRWKMIMITYLINVIIFDLKKK